VTCKPGSRNAPPIPRPALQRATVALLILPLLAGCAGSDSSVRAVIRRDLPAPPAYLAPVAVPEPKTGEHAVAVAARERAGRLKANSIIRNARAQWEKLRKTYQQGR
jgi:hypothetical protein